MVSKIGVIIQARMGSERYPGKVLCKIGDKEILLFLYQRLQYVKNIDNIVVATSTDKSDTPLVNFCRRHNIDCFKGSLEDVLGRFYHCAKSYNLDCIVRVTADDPFKDIGVIEKAIQIYVANNFDYVSNTLKPTYPEGIDIEVFSFKSLEIAHRESSLKSERNHVTPYIWKNTNKFLIHNFEDNEDNSNVRLTCDYPEDLEYMNKIIVNFSDENFTYLDILQVLNERNIQHPKKIIRNEGYLKDFKKERNE